MTDTFTWRPVSNPTGTSTFAVLTSQFGDGYSQEAADGINNETQSWPLDFVGVEVEMQPIVNFIRAHAGFQGFYWTPPMGVQGLYKVATFSINPQDGGLVQISATFVQKFQP